MMIETEDLTGISMIEDTMTINAFIKVAGWKAAKIKRKEKTIFKLSWLYFKSVWRRRTGAKAPVFFTSPLNPLSLRRGGGEWGSV